MRDDLGDDDGLCDDLLVNLYVIHLTCLSKLDFFLDQLCSLERQDYHHDEKDVEQDQQAQETPPTVSDALSLCWLGRETPLKT
jgi:hypothetical protein